MDRAFSLLRARLIVALFVVLLVLSFGASQANAAVAPDAAEVTFTETRLSNERDTSRWAFVTRKTVAYSQPMALGHRVRKLTTRTPDRTNELVLTLVERTYSDGSIWVKARLPMRGSGKTGWIRRGALGAYNVIHTRMVVNRKRFTAKLYKNEKVIWRARIGVGKKGTATPSGKFYVRDRLITSNKRGLYGPYAFGLSAYSRTLTDWPGGGMIGIHGTDEPELIPGRVSHGCVRVKNRSIRRLRKLLPPGTPVVIR